MHVVGDNGTRTGGSLSDRAARLLSGTAALALGYTEPLRSWECAQIVLGLSHTDPFRAAELLERLLAAQWRNGLIPHLSLPYQEDAPPPAWSVAAAHAPAGIATSPLAHPPLHASAAKRITDALDTDGAEFAAAVYPRLAAWHDYLLASRVRRDVLLAEVWHPTETGMDNSPMWDVPLATVSESAGARAAPRPSLRPAPAADAADALLTDLADKDYLPDRIRATARFAVHDVLFNSLLVRAELDLAEIARRAGYDGQRHVLRSRRIATLLNRELFDPHNAWYVDRDVLTGRALPLASAAQLAPMYGGVPDPARAALLADMWRAMSAPPAAPTARMMASADPEQRDFSPANGWRGPAWYVTNWLIHEGLVSYGFAADAAMLRDTMLRVVDQSGFWQHYDIFEGEGGGMPNHLPTAALALDLLSTEAGEPVAA